MKRTLINAAAMLVIVAGAATRLTAQATTPSGDAPACCHTVLTSATCCGTTCESGWFNCSAQT